MAGEQILDLVDLALLLDGTLSHHGADEVDSHFKKIYKELAKTLKLPGFRKGKAPYDLVLQRFGEDTVRKEAAESLLGEVYDKALEQEGIELRCAADPRLGDVGLSLQEIERLTAEHNRARVDHGPALWALICLRQFLARADG